MIALVIDTAQMAGGVALLRGEETVAERRWTGERRHSEVLWPSITDMLGEQDLALSDIDAVIVSLGPGRLTGLRIGLTVAKTICTQTRARLVAVPETDDLITDGLERIREERWDDPGSVTP